MSLFSTMSTDSTGGIILSWIAHSLIYGTLLALITWATLRIARKRIPPTIAGLFWLIVLVKFILPVGPAVPYSLANWANGLSSWLPVRTPQPAPAAPAVASNENQDVILFVGTSGASNPSAEATTTPQSAWPIVALIGYIYLACVLAIAAWRLSSYRRFAIECRRLPSADAAMQQIVCEACARLGVRRIPTVRISDAAPAPFILGGLHRCLVLSRRQLDNTNELEAVVLHEIAHLRRGDFFVRYLQWFAGTLLFFWPVVAWVNRRIDLAREHACDDWALRHGRLSAGDYARCLLRALHPVERRTIGFVPASMAKNLVSVERRIEMILDAPQRRTLGSLRLPAFAVLAAWSVFALGGAAICPPEEGGSESTGQTGDRAEPQIVKIQAQPAGAFIALDGEGGEVNVGAAREAHVQLLLSKVLECPPGEAGEGNFVFMKRDGHEIVELPGLVTEKQLTEFGQKYPTADADTDGKVTRAERNAYLAVLAMSNPTGVMTQFPKADSNKDGTLDSNEAALLVTGGIMEFEAAVDGPQTIALGEGAPKGEMRVIRMEKPLVVAKDAPEGATAAGAWVIAGEGGANQPPVNVKGMCFEAGPNASKWLLENVTAQPTTADVTKMLAAVQEAPNTRFLQIHPDADTNGDGKLSSDERKAHIEKQMSDVRARMLRRHPEADTDGDGTLSKEEERAFFTKRTRALIQADGQAVSTDGDHQVIFQRAGASAPQVFYKTVEGADAEGVHRIELKIEAELQNDDTDPAEAPN